MTRWVMAIMARVVVAGGVDAGVELAADDES